MSEIIETRNPELIAAEINAIKRSTAKYVLQQSIEIGRLLVEAKEAVPYGSWGVWLETNCEYSTTNANNLMRIYTEYGADAQISFFEDNRLELYGNLNRSQAIALLSLPRQERDDFVRQNDVESMSVSELEEKIKAAKDEAKAETEKRLREEYRIKLAATDQTLEQLRENAKTADEKVKQSEAAAEKAKKALAESAKERDKIAAQRNEYEKKLGEAQIKLDEMQDRLEEAQSKPAQITDEERENIIATANLQTAEKMAGLEAEITRLRAAANVTVQKCAVYFAQMQSAYAEYTALVETEADEAVRTKLRAAFNALIERMRE